VLVLLISAEDRNRRYSASRRSRQSSMTGRASVVHAWQFESAIEHQLTERKTQ
jgi:hypothetical protein